MFKYLFITSSIILLGVILCFVFYFNQRVIDINNKFEPINTLFTDEDLTSSCVITGDWNEYINKPIKIMRYGYPYEVLFAISSSQFIKKIELLNLHIQYDSLTCVVKNFRTEIKKSGENMNKYYIIIQNFPILHDVGKIVKLKYKVKIIFKDRIIEKELEAEFKATRGIEKSYRIIDMYMGV